MRQVLSSIVSLLLGIGTMLIGLGALNTLLGVRGGVERFPEVVIGAVMSAYFLGFIGGTFLWPGVIARVGHIRAFTAFAALAAVDATLHGLLVDPWAWALLRAIGGACVVGLYMVVESWLNSLTGSAQRGRVFATYMVVCLLSMALGQYLLLVADVRDFVLFGIAAMFFSLALVPVALTRVSAPEPAHAPRLGLRHLYAVSPLALVGAIASGLVGGALWGMGPLFVSGLGLDDLAVATFMSAAIVGGVLLQWPIGLLSDRIDRRLVLTGACFAGGLLALLMYASAGGSTRLLMASAFLYGGFGFTLYSLSVAHVNDHLNPGEIMEATGSMLLLYGIGAVIGPLAAGGVMQMAGPVGMPAFIAGVLLPSGLFAAWRTVIGTPIPAEERVEFVAVMRTSQEALELDPRSDAEPEMERDAA